MSLSAIFDEAAARRVFPGGVVFCARGEQISAHQAFGTTAYDDAISQLVTRETVYDVASLSKLFTLKAFLIAKRDAKISENEPLARFLPEFDTSDKRAITLRHLMMHSAGFSLHLQRLQGEACENWIESIAGAPLESAPGEKVNYTCTAYFLLARVIEKLCGTSSDKFIEKAIFRQYDLNRTSFRPIPQFALDEIAPTEVKEDGKAWQGIVHDEAARQWQSETGSFCGNAGVFSTAQDLAEFCRTWNCDLDAQDAKDAFSDTLLENAEGGVLRGWGWQLHNETYMTKEAPPGTAGHQGFTGPTLIFNPHTRDIVIVLNNRVYPTRNGPARFVYHRRIAHWHFQQFSEAK